MVDEVLEGDVVVPDEDDAVEGTAVCGGRADEGTEEGGGGPCEEEEDDDDEVRTGLRRCSGRGPP